MMNDELAIKMQENLNLVWNERDPVLRGKAIARIYSTNASLNHVGDQVTGYEAINESVSATQKMLPPNFVFSQLKPVVINNNMGRLIWGAGPAGEPVVATGMDIACFEEDKIKSLYVFLDS